MTSEREHRCSDCGTLVSTSSHFCTQCGGSSLIWVEGGERVALEQWAAYLSDRRARYQLDQEEEQEPTVVCNRCKKRIQAEEAWHSRDEGKALCGTCRQQEISK